MSLRFNSFFEGFKFDYKTGFKIMYKYLNWAAYVDIDYDLGISRNTVGIYCSLMREVICEYIADFSEQIGGLNPERTPKVVEIDESLFL